MKSHAFDLIQKQSDVNSADTAKPEDQSRTPVTCDQSKSLQKSFESDCKNSA